MEASVNIRVECNDNPGVRQIVLQMLRQAKARDVTENKQPSCTEIRASYYLDDNRPDKLEDIADLIRMQSGVFLVEMLENHNMVKQNH